MCIRLSHLHCSVAPVTSAAGADIASVAAVVAFAEQLGAQLNRPLLAYTGYGSFTAFYSIARHSNVTLALGTHRFLAQKPHTSNASRSNTLSTLVNLEVVHQYCSESMWTVLLGRLVSPLLSGC